MKSLFLVAGEVSGDTHGAALMAALEARGGESWILGGLGGPKMRDRSERVEDWLGDAAVLGLWEVLKRYGYFRRKMGETVRRIREEAPDGVVLIDYPGFNLRLAARLRKEGYHGRLIYYISPQVWAWKRGRIRTMAQLLDLMICIFPFEKTLYEASGLPTTFAGHPLVDAMEEVRRPGLERDLQLVALLPGSREREIAKLFPPMLDAAERLLRVDPDRRFATTGATPELTDRLRRLVAARGLEASFEIGERSSHEIMQRAAVGAVASGTATLEAACLGLPHCLVYRVAGPTARVARRVMAVDHLGIVNVMAGREVVTELLQERANGAEIAAELVRLLCDRDAREQLRAELAEIASRLGEGGSHRNAAEAVAALWGGETPG